MLNFKFLLLASLLGTRIGVGMSRKAELADEPHIENLLEKYSSHPDLIVLALGSSYWIPPELALTHTMLDLQSDVLKYLSSSTPLTYI